MGIAANEARLMTLTARQHDLELRAQSISQRKLINAASTAAVALEYSRQINAAYASDGTVNEGALNTAQAYYEGQTAQLSKDEKMLDLELQQINTEHTAVKTEYDSTKSLISDNTEKSFSLFG